MSELAKLKQQHAATVSSQSSLATAATATAAGTTTGTGSEQSSGGQMRMMQQMVNSAVDPFLGLSVVSGSSSTVSASGIESHTGQRNTTDNRTSSLGQCATAVPVFVVAITDIC